MDAREEATFAMTNLDKEAGTSARRNSFYFDLSLLKRESFLRYLVSIILR